VISCLALGLIILSPVLFAIVPLPEGEHFSELWLLGPDRTIAGAPFTISLNTPYSVHIGVGDHMGAFEYYKLCVKLRNQFQSLQETEIGLPSPLTPIFEYRLFLKNNETWEADFAFSFEEITYEGNLGHVSRLLANGQNVSVDTLLTYDETSGGFGSQLLFELWVYNTTIQDFQYHDRQVWIWLNLNKA
jgi:uncharacterized membrane protein